MRDSDMVTVTIPMYVVRHIRVALKEQGYTENLKVFNKAFWDSFNIPGWDQWGQSDARG